MAGSPIEILEQCQERLNQEIAAEEAQQDPLHLVVGSLRERKKLVAREINRLRIS